MTPQQIAEHKAAIDQMSQKDMANLWRFAPVGHPYFSSAFPLFEYFNARFRSLGGFTSEISKAIDQKQEQENQP